MTEHNILFLADHASNYIPKEYKNLGLSKKLVNSHIAYDIGIKDITLSLSKLKNSFCILGQYSRLLIDLNRDINDPTIIPEIIDKKLIFGNFNLKKSERKNRVENIYKKYHSNIQKLIKEKKINVIISLHSFNPVFKRKKRNIQIGVLSNSDRSLSNKFLENLFKTNYIIGDNEPYRGNLVGDSMHKHGLKNNIFHSLIEIRNDLIRNSSQIEKMSSILSNVITNSLKNIL